MKIQGSFALVWHQKHSLPFEWIEMVKANCNGITLLGYYEREEGAAARKLWFMSEILIMSQKRGNESKTRNWNTINIYVTQRKFYKPPTGS